MIWAFATIAAGVRIAESVTIGSYAHIGEGVVVGARSKVQNSAQVFGPAVLGEGVFIGPGVILTNDKYPRSVNVDGTRKTHSDWVQQGVEIGEGASIGAQAICIAPVKIGKWAMIGAGAIVSSDVPDYALIIGNSSTPAAWVGEAGIPLEWNAPSGAWRCSVTGQTYVDDGGRLRPVGLSS